MNEKRPMLMLAAGVCALLAAVAVRAETLTARFGVTLSEKTHQGQGAAKFAELVNQKTQGRVQIKVFYNASLGNDVTMTSALQGGTLEFVVPQSSTLTGMVKELEILDFPFLFDNEKEAEAVLDGPLGRKLLERLPEKGLVALGYWENGFFNITNSRRTITRVEDFQGLKLRALQAKISLETIKALGANPVPMAIPELYTALETRTLDGQGTPSSVTYALKLNEVQKYLSLTRHAYGAFVPLVGKKFWDRLGEADRKALLDAALEVRAYQRQVARDQAKSAEQAMAAKGLLINEVSPAERLRMRDKVKPVWDAVSADVGPDIYKEMTGELARLRGK